MNNHFCISFNWLLPLLYFQLSFSFALGYGNDREIAAILKSDKAPVGVVFEIVTSENGLNWAIPAVRHYVSLLKAKYPEIRLAVVSHGREQFALTKNNSTKFKPIHKQVKQLAEIDGVPVHICETHAGWRGVQSEDFPTYVTVSTQGPQEIRNYQEFGYKLIVLRRAQENR